MSKNLEETKEFGSSKILLICEKCGSKHLMNGANPSELMRKWIKEKLTQKNLKKELRPVLTSCLGICPEDKITTGVLSTQEKRSHFYLINPSYSESDCEIFLEKILNLRGE